MLNSRPLVWLGNLWDNIFARPYQVVTRGVMSWGQMLCIHFHPSADIYTRLCFLCGKRHERILTRQRCDDNRLLPHREAGEILRSPLARLSKYLRLFTVPRGWFIKIFLTSHPFLVRLHCGFSQILDQKHWNKKSNTSLKPSDHIQAPLRMNPLTCMTSGQIISALFVFVKCFCRDFNRVTLKRIILRSQIDIFSPFVGPQIKP